MNLSMSFLKFKTIFLLFLLLGACQSSGDERLAREVPEGVLLLEDPFQSFTVYSPEDQKDFVQVKEVEGPGFDRAFHVSTFGLQPRKHSHGIEARFTDPVSKGDVLWISFFARSIKSTRESGETPISLRVDQLVNGKYQWPPHFEQGLSIGSEWVEVAVPFEMEKNAEIDQLRIVLDFDTYPQEFQIGPITVINGQKRMDIADYPRTRVRYGGDEADAPWRKEAEENIRKHRMGELELLVKDKEGKELSGAEVELSMIRNAFNWGTAVNTRYLLDTENPDVQNFRDTLKRYFNQVVFDNELKWPVWIKEKGKDRGKNVREAIVWIKEQNISTRGHVMVWPSWQHLPGYLQEFEKDPERLLAEVDQHIEEQSKLMAGYLDEWDVINEPYNHHDLMDILGWEVQTEWFKKAKGELPEVQFFLNDYTMFHGEDHEKPSQDFFDNVQSILDQGGPVEGIGEQAHIGGTPPSIEKVKRRLDQFAELGLPIIITEFDINSNDDDFKARYMDDFMTLVYSHPATKGFIQWGFWEKHHWFPIAALWNSDWSRRPQGDLYCKRVSETWWTEESGKTDQKGRFHTQGFTGTYRIKVSANGQEVEKEIQLDKEGKRVEVQFY